MMLAGAPLKIITADKLFDAVLGEAGKPAERRLPLVAPKQVWDQ